MGAVRYRPANEIQLHSATKIDHRRAATVADDAASRHCHRHLPSCPVAASPYYWYCFESADSSSLRDGPFEDADNDHIADYPYDSSSWIPQGITGVSDALDDEDWNGNSGLIVSWYHNGSNGVRISVLNTAAGTYRHVLLAYPFWNSILGRYDFTAINVHAGGIVWYGDYLYIVDTNWGIRVFDTQHIFDVGASTNGTTQCSGIGWDDGLKSYCAATYKYAMTQVGFWQRPQASDENNYCNGTVNNPRFSYISLDRSTVPDRLIVGEYCPGSASRNGRLVAYDMNNGSTVTHQLNDGTPDDYWTLPVSNIQGLATNGLYFYLNQSKGHGNGLMHKALASSHEMTLSNPALTVPIGPEDLTLHRGSATLFSVTEHLHSGQQGRMIYAVPTVW